MTSVAKIVVPALLCDLLAFTAPLPLFPRIIDDFRSHSSDWLIRFSLDALNQARELVISLSRYGRASALADPRWDVTLLGGILGSSFSFCQFFISPRLGRWSDVYGRRTVLLWTMLGNLASALLWVFSSSFSIYAVSRLVGGLSEGNVQLSIAILTDVTAPEKRSRVLALVGLSFSLAFTFGPTLGALLASSWARPSSPWLNTFAYPALFTLVLLSAETIALYKYLPETRRFRQGEEDKERAAKRESYSVDNLASIHFVYLLFFSGAEFSIPFLTHTVLGYSPMQNGYVLGYIGIVAALFQGGYVRRYGANPARIVALGLMAFALSMVFYASVPFTKNTTLLMGAGSTCVAFTTATVVTGLTTLTSLASDPEHSGAQLGRFRGRGQLGRAMGPILSTTVYWIFGPPASFALSAIGAVVTLVMVRKATSLATKVK